MCIKYSKTQVILFLDDNTNSLCNVVSAQLYMAIFVHLLSFLSHVLFGSVSLCGTCTVCVHNPDCS